MAENKFYVTVGRDPRGDAYIAAITLGHERKGDENIVVLDVCRCKTEKEGQEWGQRQLADPEWYKRLDGQKLLAPEEMKNG